MKEKKNLFILGIESSCDETSCAIVKNGTQKISNVVLSQIDIHKDFGGVVPEVASRHHVKNITMIIEQCLKEAKMTMQEITAIAITYGPGLIGSLLVGLEAAKTLSYIFKKPLIPVHHLAGHIYANNLVEPLSFPLIALIVSGGHTELVYMKEHYSFEILGGTLDDAVGECYDKVARVANLGYPGGPKVDSLAYEGIPAYDLPMPLDDDSYNFSFSGLKSAVINLAHREHQLGRKIDDKNLAASFQKSVVDILTKKTLRAMKNLKVKNLIVAGGVAANRSLRNRLKELCQENGYKVSFPSIEYCTDNAAMIAAAGYYAYQLGRRADLTLNSISSEILN